ncbi:MAG: circularly permuted type 2 ATP-grasp protein [Jatrophihabitans sp.]|uniref:circularly permuted type 2 ATP-grasp protein n=1 Tax=Jatrophihabitans sp. TaxID=1932789 RepID=UPI003F823D5D
MSEALPRYDEMTASGGVRPAWREVQALVDVLGVDGLRERRDLLARLLEDDGAGYRPVDAEAEQPWALDPLPLVLDEHDWADLDSGLQQRADLLDAVLTDLYGPRRLLADGLLPPEVVFGHDGFLREADGIRLAGDRQLFLTATDLGRDHAGRWTVLADRTQAPSGAGYAMENRRAVSRALPGLYRTTPVQRLGPFFAAVRASLQRLAPHDAARVVLLTAGPRSETAFDQAFLSNLLGFPLVEGADLEVRDGRVWQRSVGRRQPVDVIVRRVDGWFCDPLDLRPDSQLGTPGLLEAARLGNVAIVNGVGAGVLENPGLFPFLPAIARTVLGDDLRLPTVPTWWCGDPVGRDHVLARLDRLVVKPISRPLGRGSHFVWELDAAARDDLRGRILAAPHAWVGQEPLDLSTVPTVGDHGLRRRPLVLRTFAVAAGTGYRVLPGGLARVAPDDRLHVASGHGAVSKDVWVLSAAAATGDDTGLGDVRPPEAVETAVPPRVAEDLFWLGRYAERAEAVTRLLRITDNRWHDVRPEGDAAVARCLVVLLEAVTEVTATHPGFVGAGAARRLAAPRDELLALVTDETRAGTLAHAVRRLREAAAAVRDQLSNDTWVVLGDLDRVLGGLSSERGWLAADDIAPSLARVLESLLAFAGLVAESMVRDTGWHLLDAGRRLERAQQLVALLRACLATVPPPAVDELVVESVLIAAESIVTHRRRYPAGAGVDTVLALLLADADNPRSLAHQLTRLRHDIGRLPAGRDDTVLRLLARLGAVDVVALARATDGRRTELVRFLDETADGLRALGDELAATHFAQPVRPRSFDAVLAPA